MKVCPRARGFRGAQPWTQSQSISISLHPIWLDLSLSDGREAPVLEQGTAISSLHGDIPRAPSSPPHRAGQAVAVPALLPRMGEHLSSLLSSVNGISSN